MAIEVITKTVSDVIQEVERTFGDESGVQLQESDVIRWINRAQLEISSRNPEINSALAQADSIADKADYPLRDSVSDILTLEAVHYKNIPVKSMTFQEAQLYLMEQSEPVSSAERPTFWYEHAGVLTFYPPPAKSEVGAVKVYYNKYPKPVENSGQMLSVPDSYYNSVISYCMKQAYAMDENFQASGAMSNEFDIGVQLQQQRTLSQINNYPSITILPED